MRHKRQCVSRRQCSGAANSRCHRSGCEQDGSPEEGCPCCRDGGQRQVVTHNIKDFSPQVLSRYGLAKVRPDAFCVGLLASHETRVLAGIRDAPGQPQEDADVASPVHRPSRRRPTGRAQVGSRIGITRPGDMRRVHHRQHDPGRWRAHPGDGLESDRRRWKHTEACARTRGQSALTVYGRPETRWPLKPRLARE